MTDTERVTRHVIAALDYSEGFLECTCGAVMQAEPRAGEWPRHGLEVGAPLRISDAGEWRGRYNGTTGPRRTGSVPEQVMA